MIRPRRSLLFMPGSNARALEKARNLPADGIILDLEDSGGAGRQRRWPATRSPRRIAAGGFGKREVLIRGQQPRYARGGSTTSPWPARPGPTASWFPRFPASPISTPSPNRLSDINADMSIRVWAMHRNRARRCWTPTSSPRRRRILRPGSPASCFGPNDISRETRIRMQPGRAAMIPMITHCILATRAHGLEILDGPYSDISNIDGFAVECAQGRDLGFDGKTLIHPEPYRGLQRHLHAAGGGGRRKRARSSRHSSGRKTLPAAPSSSTGGWWERLHADMARGTIAIADAIAAMWAVRTSRPCEARVGSRGAQRDA